MKKILWVIGCLVGCILFISPAFAYDVETHVGWSYNGDPVDGFIIYKLDSADVAAANATEVKRIVGGELRTWDGTLPAENGKNHYTMSAYTTAEEGEKNPKSYTYEYLHIESGIGIPTMVIRFN